MENRIVMVNAEDEISSRALLPINTANELQVDSQQQLEVAGEIVRTLKDLQDEINKTFEPIVKQAFAAHKAAKKAQNDHLEPLQNAEAVLRGKINTYLRKVELERLSAQAARQKAEDNLRQQPAAQKPLFSSAPSVAPPKLPEVPAQTKAEGMSTVQDWKWKVIDVSEIPAELWILDEDAITKTVNMMKGATKIPGIEVWPESRAVIRR